MRKLKVVVFNPGEAPSVRQLDYSIPVFEKIVGGPITIFSFHIGRKVFTIVCHDEGRNLNLPANRYIDDMGGYVAGPFLIYRKEGTGGRSLTEPEITEVFDYFKGKEAPR